MNKIALIIYLILTIWASQALCQKNDKIARQFDDPILTDSITTIFIPTRYTSDLMTSNKMVLWGDYYANIIVYNFKNETYEKLFQTDTYIKSFKYNKHENITSKWVFFLVKSVDSNGNGKIDEDDPFILFATTPTGKNLQQLTNEKENVISCHLFQGQGFGLIKIQKDLNNDKSFKRGDNEFYFKKINLNDLSFQHTIELK